MRKSLRIWAALLAVCMLAALAGCGDPAPSGTTAAPSTLPAVNVGAIYTEALSGTANADKTLISVEDSRTVALGKQSFEVTETGSVFLTKDAAGSLLAQVDKTIDYGSYQLEVKEVFAGGTAYAAIGENLYAQKMTGDAFAARFLPVEMLDPSLYANASVSANGKKLTFFDATAAEDWAGLSENATLQSAQATVTLDSLGAVASTVYELQWQEGAALISRKVTARICLADDRAVEVPENAEEYAATEHLDAVYALEEAFGLMIQAESVTSVIQETLVSQALGISRVAKKSINAWGKSPELLIRTKQELTQIHYSNNEVTSETMDEIFRSGIYTYSYNGGPWEQSNEVNFGLMLNHYQTLLLSNIWEIGSFEGISVSTENGLTLYTFICGEDFDNAIRAEINNSLFQDETYLDTLSSSYRSGENSYYMAIDNATGLITAVGCSYTGYHTIAGTEYALIRQADQSFDLASMSSYQTITGEAEPTEEPAEKATPLFYKVTGSDGQTMWLLGTIHVGDERTAYLPQALTDAFNSADSLAVEVDILDAVARMETDSALASDLTQLYCYPDSTTADHVADQALYGRAEMLIKASGNYSTSAPLMKASVWKSLLEQFYLRQGYALTADRGVDLQLLTLAKEQGKKIIEIESVLSQSKVLYGWSDPLQELLLASVVNITPEEYYTAAAERYELWCKGDAAALTEAVLAENAPLEQADAALYAEYKKAMLTDRNALMLKAAKAYLESDETVFYAVGLAHLLGEDGLVNALTEAGYTVEQVSYE